MRLGQLIFRLQNYLIFFQKKAIGKRDCFEFNGRKIPNFYSLCNHTFRNERCIEIPVILDYLYGNSSKDILEIGNVLSHYNRIEHDIVDKYEKGNNIISIDVLDYFPNKLYDLIFSISTLEHIGFDDSNYGGTQANPLDSGEKILLAYNRLKMLLKPNGLLIFTVPLGYNSYLDNYIRQEKFDLSDCFYYKKISEKPEWKQVNWSDVDGLPFVMKSFYWHANAIMIGMFRKREMI